MKINFDKKVLTFIKDEDSLQRAVVRYLRQKKLIFISGLTKLDMNENETLMNYYRGYTSGTPDLLVLTPSANYNGLAIELKTPNGNGVLSPEQQEFLKHLEKECNFYCLVTNSLEDIIETVCLYLNEFL